MDLDESRRLEALRLFVSTQGGMPSDTEDRRWVTNMTAYLRDGTVPKFTDDGEQEMAESRAA